MRKNKYNVGSKEDRTVDGITFHSVKEAKAYVNQFRPLMKAGVKVEMQKPYQLFAYICSTSGPVTAPVCKYVADFVVTEADGTTRVYDVKGMRTEVYRLKAKWFAACYPHLRIVEL